MTCGGFPPSTYINKNPHMTRAANVRASALYRNSVTTLMQKKGGIELINYGWYNLQDSSQFEESWLKIRIPSKDTPKVIVSCDENTGGYDRHVVIVLNVSEQESELGGIEIWQDKKDE